MDFYISPEEYAHAEANGVKRGTLEWRIRDGGWDKERAVTTPPKRLVSRKKWISVAQQNGIPESIFYTRVCKGWTAERAATEPLLTQAQRSARMRENGPAKRVYSQDLIDLAAANGVSRSTFHRRVSSGWTVERAASEPLVSFQERGRRGIQTVRQQYGDINAPIFQKRG